MVWFVWNFGLDFRRLASCLAAAGLFLDSILYIRHGSWWFILSIFIFVTAAGCSSDHSFRVASFFELLRLTQRLSQHRRGAIDRRAGFEIGPHFNPFDSGW